MKAMIPSFLDPGHRWAENTKAPSMEFNAKPSVKWEEMFALILCATVFYKQKTTNPGSQAKL